LRELVSYSDGNLNLWSDALDRFLLTVDRYCGIRTHKSTVNASCAVVLNQNYVSISLEIDLVGQTQAFLGACGYAEFTPFADLFGYCYFAPYHREMPLSSIE
jgi:hypothetical protein